MGPNIFPPDTSILPSGRDENGRIIWGDELMVLLSREILKEKPGVTIIAEVKCSQNLFNDIAAHGGVPLMWKAGHSLIKAKMKETNAALAGEMSGHIFFADRFYGFDDATYAGARILEICRKPIKKSELLAICPKHFPRPSFASIAQEEQKSCRAETCRESQQKNEVITIDCGEFVV